ncbi:MAG: chemotaxis-specific protein-glutamate methyltransferase CheB [Nitrospirae bacterium]|nr:chemotaxis-specific protein-glutamate methyltransferase CheB [Nitrospirota bacterium]MBF0592339.1 chemotaxis-specific protein-glutamate methyltransferase CheB [Nitrospirota bacterium]
MVMKKIRVFLIDDSQIALAVLKRMLAYDPDIEVVGAFTNAAEALRLIPTLSPDVICTDLHMPGMDGLVFTRTVMERFPLPILVISVSVQEHQTHTIFELLDNGAIDVFPKPKGILDGEFEKQARELTSKVKILSGVVAFTRHKKRPQAYSKAERLPIAVIDNPHQVRMVAIGASTGGPQVLHNIFRNLPADFPAPIVCVQHISEGFLDGFIDWLAQECALKIVKAPHGLPPIPGNIYFPQEGFQLEVDNLGRFNCINRAGHEGHCPSVTLTFRSVAQYYGKTSVGIILTGMGRDGADGILDIARAGGITIAQDEQSCVVFGMPRQAIELGAIRCVLPADDIAAVLQRLRFTDCRKHALQL